MNFTVPLREHFSLPFIFCQFLVVGQFLKPNHAHNSRLVMVFISSLLFTITWQFAQFVLLIQALVLFCLATVGLLDRDRVISISVILLCLLWSSSFVQVCRLLSVDLFVMVSVWYLQFYQPMVITSLIVSLVPTAILSLQVSWHLLASTGCIKSSLPEPVRWFADRDFEKCWSLDSEDCHSSLDHCVPQHYYKGDY